MTQLHTSTWQPPADLKTHSGNPPRSDAIFFVPPPPTIGRLISIDTTFIDTFGRPLPIAKRWLLAVLLGFVSLAILLLLNYPIFVGIIVALFGGGMILFVTRFKHLCSYVGTDGIVSYVMTGSTSAIPKESFLLFKDAHSLHTKTIKNYTNGSYISTDYTYTWKKYSGNTHVLSGSYTSENKPPHPIYPWHFANMAESAWSGYVLSTVEEQLDRQGYIEFSVVQPALQAVRIGRGFMEFVTKKEGTQRVLGSDMLDISLGSGKFQFKHQDPKWWSGKGKYSFEYANIPNARVFLICLEDLAGISWG